MTTLTYQTEIEKGETHCTIARMLEANHYIGKEGQQAGLTVKKISGLQWVQLRNPL